MSLCPPIRSIKKGKTVFTIKEAKAIERLLQELPLASPFQRTEIRKLLRLRGFFISDFSNRRDGFTLEKFHRLVEERIISIVTDPPIKY